MLMHGCLCGFFTFFAPEFNLDIFKFAVKPEKYADAGGDYDD